MDTVSQLTRFTSDEAFKYEILDLFLSVINLHFIYSKRNHLIQQ